MKSSLSFTVIIFLFVSAIAGSLHSQPTDNSASRQAGTIPAFPTAQGYGAKSVGGRGGEVIMVTNLNDSGQGSFRAAAQDAQDPRMILFKVGGTIKLLSPVTIRNPYITIAGHTALGDGILLTGESLRINTHDVIIRYLRVRPGDEEFGEIDWDNQDALQIGDSGKAVYNIIIDHSSFSWGIDENVSTWFKNHDITIQNSIISEALYHSKHSERGHSMGLLLGSEGTGISVLDNLFAHNNERNPMIKNGGITDFRNNVIYNPGRIAGQIDEAMIGNKMNYVNNYIKWGLDSHTSYSGKEMRVKEDAAENVQLYIDGNLGPNASAVTDDNWNMVTKVLSHSPWHTPLELDRRVHREFDHPLTITHTAQEAYNLVLENAGANIPKRDVIDERIVQDVKNGTGRIIDSPSDVGGYPVYETGAPLEDSDNDGIPDAWEIANGLNLNDPADSEQMAANGYTNIENYLNELAGDPVGNFTSVGERNWRPTDFVLEQNYPNPFNPETHIEYQLSKASQVTLKIYNIKGQDVRTLVNSNQSADSYSVVWDGKNDAGEFVTSGMYFYKLRIDESFFGTRKMLFLK